jgi:hypothetical protein
VLSLGSGVLGFRSSGVPLLLIALATACGGHRFVVPSGAGEPAPDAASAWTEATTSCRDVHTFTAALRVSGHAGAAPLRGTILAGVTSANQIRLDAPSVFILAGTADRATFIRSSDHRVLIARGDDILEALTGLKLEPRALLAMFSGCAGQASEMKDGMKHGEVLAITTSDAHVYLQRRMGRWRVIGAEVAGLVVDYRDTTGEWPADLRLTSAPGRTPAIALSVSAGQIEVNSTLAASAFDVAMPANATPLTLEELRAQGPLGNKR